MRSGEGADQIGHHVVGGDRIDVNVVQPPPAKWTLVDSTVNQRLPPDRFTATRQRYRINHGIESQRAFELSEQCATRHVESAKEEEGVWRSRGTGKVLPDRTDAPLVAGVWQNLRPQPIF